jgi:hypothetical protein
MDNSKKYGKYYWCVMSNLFKDGRIYLWADNVALNEGDLFFLNPDEIINMCFARGSWKGFYAASCLDGTPVAVEHM